MLQHVLIGLSGPEMGRRERLPPPAGARFRPGRGQNAYSVLFGKEGPKVIPPWTAPAGAWRDGGGEGPAPWANHGKPWDAKLRG